MTYYVWNEKRNAYKFFFVGKLERKSLRRLYSYVGGKLLKFIVMKYSVRIGVDKFE